MKIIYGVYFVVICIRLSHLHGTEIISQTAIKDIGGTVEMKCTVSNVDSICSVSWLKFDKGGDPTKPVILSIGKSLSIEDSRFSLRVDNENSSPTLKIQNIRIHDAASYRCKVTCDDINSDNNTSASVELEVNRPPVILKSSSLTTMVMREGITQRLECYADGFPKPRVFWSRQFNGILTTGGTFYRGNVLPFTNVSKYDRGAYYCNAVNGVGKGARHTVDLRVEFAPVVTVTNNMFTLGEPLMYEMTVQCFVEAYPTPKIDWINNGVKLHSNEYHRIVVTATNHQFTYSNLNILKIEKSQYGDYKCKAWNSVGTAEVIFKLIESKYKTPKNDTPTTSEYPVDST